METNCRLCGNNSSTPVYEGPIRKGGVGSKTLEGYNILKCVDCGFVYLDPLPENLDSFYETHEYRSQWDYKFLPDDIHRKYDSEQNERIVRIGVQNIRGRSILDLGASAGIFLDTVQSLASETVAVEPCAEYREYLITRGHGYYSYPEDAIQDGVKTDIVTSFDVIEHVADPIKFIKVAYSLLEPGGTFVLSMPNLNDLILNCNKQAFEPFFYQLAHINYFSSQMIPKLFEKSGFGNINIDFLHKYGIDNLVQWTKSGMPGKMDEIGSLFDRTFNIHYRGEIERLGISSHLFITAKKPL